MNEGTLNNDHYLEVTIDRSTILPDDRYIECIKITKYVHNNMHVLKNVFM